MLSCSWSGRAQAGSRGTVSSQENYSRFWRFWCHLYLDGRRWREKRRILRLQIRPAFLSDATHTYPLLNTRTIEVEIGGRLGRLICDRAFDHRAKGRAARLFGHDLDLDGVADDAVDVHPNRVSSGVQQFGERYQSGRR